MPLLTKIYRISYKNVEGTTYDIEITDIESIPFEGASVEYIDLVGGEDPLKMTAINNGDDIYQRIFGTKVTMTFKNTAEVNMNTFKGQDNRFSVWIGAIGFRGYLIMDDITEPYLPPGQEVTLVATDNLGALHDIELSDADGEIMLGKFKIIDFVYNCLLKTNLIHNGTWSINVMNNLYEESHANRTANIKNCAWEQTYLNAFTFEKAEGVFFDCYTVLERILFSWGMRLFGYMGNWWITRHDEYKESNALTSTTMWYTKYSGGVSVSGHEAIFEKTIDTDKSHEGLPADRHQYGDTHVFSTRPLKEVLFEYKYAFPPALIRNQGFLRGERDTTVPGDFFYAYLIDDWTLKRGWPGSPIAINTTAWVRKILDAYNYFIEYWVQINSPSNQDARPPYLESYPLDVCIGDKIEVSVDYKVLTGSTGGSSTAYAVMNLVLHGADGSWWKLDHDDNGENFIWRNTSNWTVFTNSGQLTLDFSTLWEWTTQELIAPPLPVTGELYIWLNGLNTSTDADDDIAMMYSNLQVTYKPLILGQYTKFEGESYKITNPQNYIPKREEELWMADPPCQTYRGGLMTLDGVYSPTSAWYDWKLANASPTPVISTSNRFAWWQTQAMWNQYRLGKRLFQGSWKGIDSGTAEPLWLLHRIKITSVSEHNQYRKFIWLSLEMNLRTCTYSGVLAEIDDTSDPRSYTEELEFKYKMSN